MFSLRRRNDPPPFFCAQCHTISLRDEMPFSPAIKRYSALAPPPPVELRATVSSGAQFESDCLPRHFLSMSWQIAEFLRLFIGSHRGRRNKFRIAARTAQRTTKCSLASLGVTERTILHHYQRKMPLSGGRQAQWCLRENRHRVDVRF